MVVINDEVKFQLYHRKPTKTKVRKLKSLKALSCHSFVSVGNMLCVQKLHCMQLFLHNYAAVLGRLFGQTVFDCQNALDKQRSNREKCCEPKKEMLCCVLGALVDSWD